MWGETYCDFLRGAIPVEQNPLAVHAIPQLFLDSESKLAVVWDLWVNDSGPRGGG